MNVREWKVVIKYRLGGKEDYKEYRVKAQFSDTAKSIAVTTACREFPKASWLNVHDCRLDGVGLAF